jgi:hypothetical protein
MAMRCGKCKGEVEPGAAGCPHCGAKFTKKPAAPPPDNDAMWGADPAPAPAPPSAPAPIPMRPSRGGRVINTGRPAVDTAGNVRTVGGTILTVLILVGIGIRACVRWNASSTKAGWQTVENADHTIEPGKLAGGKMNSEINGTYVLEVHCKEGEVGIAITRIAGDKPTAEEAVALMLAMKDVPQGRTEILTGPVAKGNYLWMVKNRSDEKPARVHVELKGSE